MTHTPPPASPQSASLLQMRGQYDVVVQEVSSGSFAPMPQNVPDGQSAGSSQAMFHSPGHIVKLPAAMQLGPPGVVRQHMSVVRSHWVAPHQT
jgi:hypothetical protein